MDNTVIQMLMNEILKEFHIEAELTPYGDGHINSTFRCPPFIMQRINTEVFKSPAQLMENIENVTAHVKKKIAERGGDVDRETLTIIRTKENKTYYNDNENYYRVYKFIENAYTVNITDDLHMIESAAEAIGRFQDMLSDFPAETLHETIVDFHNTPARLGQLDDAIAKNLSGRLSEVSAEIEFVNERRNSVSAITAGIADGLVPLRVSHNDTKLNNIMFDASTNNSICVIDLDTVMPGSFLYDYGDFLRFAGNTAAEDEKDLSKVTFSMDIFKAFTKGYLKAAGGSLTEKEISLMPESARLMTLECGMRFLADHINGDIYFGISREGHNLDRARTQFKLVSEIESKMDEMKEYIKSLLA